MTAWRESINPWGVSRSTILAAVALVGFLLPSLSCSRPKPITGATVTGVLLDQSGAPQPKTQIKLIKVRLVTLRDEEIRNLPPPPNELIIIDSDGKPVAIVETDSAGKFEFKDVPTGRYSVALQSKGLPAWLESSGQKVFFDVVGIQGVDVGTVNPGTQR